MPWHFKVMPQLLFLFLFFVLALLFLRYFENHAIFYPTRQIQFLPRDSGLDFEDVFFKTLDNIELNAWFIPSPKAKFTILFCHGNAGNISHRLEKILFLHSLGCNVFIFDYRGYGLSKDSPSEKGLYLDTRAAFDYLLSRGISQEQIIGYCESIGSAAIIDLASIRPMRALITEGAFSNGKDMAKYSFPFLPYWVFSLRLDSENKVKLVKITKLMIHSLNDEIVPFKLGRKLYDAAPAPKELFEIRGGHNSCFFDSQNILSEKMADFLDKLAK
jgi:fermentation-respiration switch protein FrsA (DUF1100 family)